MAKGRIAGRQILEKDFGHWIVRNRWWILTATFLVVVVSGSGVRFLTVNNDSRVFFSEKNPQLRALETLEYTYTKDQNVLFVIAPKDGNVFTRGTLAAVDELTQAGWQIPYSNRVDSIVNFQHSRAEGDDFIVEDLAQNPGGMSSEDLERVKRIALSQPLLVNRLISAAGHVTAVTVNILLPGESFDEVSAVAAFARTLVKKIHQKYPGIEIFLTGGVMSDNAFGEASQNDMIYLVPLMFVVLIFITGLSLRSFSGTFTALLIILFSMITGMGLAGWLGIYITAASANAPTIILTLALADSIHILVTITQQMRLGQSKHEAIAESLRVNLQPVFLTSLTTVIGFLTMNFSDAPPFRDLGNIVAVGVIAAFVYSVFFLPSLISVLPTRTKTKPDETVSPGCNNLASFVIRRRRPIFWGTLIVIMGMITGISRIELDDNFFKYFDESYDIRQATDFVQENLTGLDTIQYSLGSGEPGGINNPEYLKKVEEFANWYRNQPKVVHVNTITDTVKRLNKNMHGDDALYYRIPERRDLAAQYLLLYELSLPFGLDLNNQINVDKSATRMISTIRDATSGELRAMDKKAREWLKGNAPEPMFTYGSGLSIIFAHISERNIKSMLGASFGALILISGILMFALRSFKIGLVSLIPNLAPAFMAFGLWGLLVGQVGLGLSVIVSLTLGIVVDDTVHFLSKYLRARREHNMIPSEAVRFSFNTVGTAMWVTTAALVVGFLVLTLSGYKMNSDMGMMSAITITLALAMDFLLLPTILMKVES